MQVLLACCACMLQFSMFLCSFAGFTHCIEFLARVSLQASILPKIMIADSSVNSKLILTLQSCSYVDENDDEEHNTSRCRCKQCCLATKCWKPPTNYRVPESEAGLLCADSAAKLAKLTPKLAHFPSNSLYLTFHIRLYSLETSIRFLISNPTPLWIDLPSKCDVSISDEAILKIQMIWIIMFVILYFY